MIAAREDLAGRLRALRAKSKALALPQSLTALEDQAKAEVRRAPYRPASAEAAVRNYEAALTLAARAR